MYNVLQFAHRGIKKPLLAVICLIGLTVGMALTSAAPSQPKTPPCTDFAGTFIFTVFAFDTADTAHGEGEIWIDGELAGHFQAHYFNIAQMGQGVLQMNGMH